MLPHVLVNNPAVMLIDAAAVYHGILLQGINSVIFFTPQVGMLTAGSWSVLCMVVFASYAPCHVASCAF